MEKFISPYLTEFRPFSKSHFFALLTIAFITVLVVIFKKILTKEKIKAKLRLIIPTLVFICFVIKYMWLILTKTFSLKDDLPLHLCEISSILVIPLFIFENQIIFEIEYFLGIGSVLQALITPSLGYDFPHIIYFQFFFYHGIVIISTTYYIVLNKFKISFLSMIRAFFILNIIGFSVLGLNGILKSNYMFLCEKPLTPSLLDFLGPWPVYLIFIDLLGLINCLIFYLPYFVYNNFKKEKK